MTASKISDLPAGTSRVITDLVPFTDISVPETRKITIGDLLAAGCAGVSLNGGSASQSLTGGSTYDKITQFDTAFSAVYGDWLTSSHADDKITATDVGVYEVHFDLSFNGTASKTYNIAIYWNNVKQAEMPVALDASNTIERVSLSYPVSVTTGATDIDLRVNTTTASDVFDLKDGFFWAKGLF